MIKSIDDIKWDYQNIESVKPNLDLLQDLPYKLPKKFIKLLKITNGGDIDYCFKYSDINLGRIRDTGIDLVFGIGVDNYDLLKEYRNPPDMFPKNIVAFSETGNGDQICFDYRDNPNTDNPPIVYRNHEADVGQDVSFVAKDFESFIKMLQEPDPEEGKKIDEILKKARES